MLRVHVTWFVKGLDVEADALAIVDVLRFSTTVSMALEMGFKTIYVFPGLGDAICFARAKKIPLLAEVGGIKPSEADMDNSPSDIAQRGWTYLSRGVDKLVIRTSAGGVLTCKAVQKELDSVFVASTVNARGVAEALISGGYRVINIVCAGVGLERFAIEDFIGAGALIHEILKVNGNVELSPVAVAALNVFRSAVARLQDFMRLSESGKIVSSTGHRSDIEIASMLNISRAIPCAKPLQDAGGAIIRKLET